MGEKRDVNQNEAIKLKKKFKPEFQQKKKKEEMSYHYYMDEEMNPV